MDSSITARRLFVSACMLLTPAVVMGAQQVRGIVVDRGDNPVAGVVVMLLDSASAVSARSLTNDQGEFRLPAPRAGTYRIRTLRIGFRPTLSDALALKSATESNQ